MKTLVFKGQCKTGLWWYLPTFSPSGRQRLEDHRKLKGSPIYMKCWVSPGDTVRFNQTNAC